MFLPVICCPGIQLSSGKVKPKIYGYDIDFFNPCYLDTLQFLGDLFCACLVLLSCLATGSGSDDWVWDATKGQNCDDKNAYENVFGFLFEQLDVVGTYSNGDLKQGLADFYKECCATTDAEFCWILMPFMERFN